MEGDINGKPSTNNVDTGAALSLIRCDTVDAINIPPLSKRVSLRTVTGESVTIL